METVTDCYYCKAPVMVAQGQVVVSLVVTEHKPTGTNEEVEYLTHKKCRKENK